jgi:uncharacterized sulfatase
MMSGLHPVATGITDFIPGHWRPYERLTVPTNRTQYLPTEIVTYAEALKRADYATGYFGKWHLGWAEDQSPMAQGFDTAHVRGGWGHFVPPVQFSPSYPVDTGQYEPDILTDMTIDFMADHREEPFLAVLSHFAVHVPLAAPEAAIAVAANREQPDDRIYNPTYVAMVESVDRSFGRLMDSLTALGLADRTLVVFTSDNGGLRQIFDKRNDELVTSNDPLRNEKGSLYEGGIRVPMFLWMPELIGAGETDVPATGLDLYPTFLELADAPFSIEQTKLDGTSLWGMATTGRDVPERDLYFYYPHYHHSEPAAAIRRGDYKLIRFFDREEPELYNLADDIGERNNLVHARPELAEELRLTLNMMLSAAGVELPVANPDFDPARRGEWGPRPK